MSFPNESPRKIKAHPKSESVNPSLLTINDNPHNVIDEEVISQKNDIDKSLREISKNFFPTQ